MPTAPPTRGGATLGTDRPHPTRAADASRSSFAMPYAMSTPPVRSAQPTATVPGHTQADADRMVLVVLILSMAMIVLVAPRLRRHPSSHIRQDVRAAIDPNVAPWWELTVLRDIGPALASEIVRYRTSHADLGRDGARWFTRPDDLTLVHGIGPKTVDGIKDDLIFDPKKPPEPEPESVTEKATGISG